MRSWEGETGSGKSDPPSSDKAGLWRGKDAECGKSIRQKVGGIDERFAYRAFHLRSASLEATIRTECWGLRGEKENLKWEGGPAVVR